MNEPATKSNSQNQNPEISLTLKPARFDLLSARIQIGIFSLILAAICLFSMSASLNSGFLLDDFLHIDYVSRAFQNDSHDFLSNFYSNWAGSPLMKSYRPLVSLSLFADYFFFGKNAWGYHLLNQLLLAGTATLVSLCSLELSGMRGNRLGACAALFAGLLFAVYPLHLEASAWIIGRVDLLCTFFSVLSIFCYLRFRLLHERYLFKLSLISFLLALLSKEMAVTVPLVIAVAELLLAPYFKDNYAPEYAPLMKQRRLTGVLAFWFLLGLFATGRLLALGTMVGGYGEGSALAALKNFLNPEPIQRLLFPINLDILRRMNGDWDLRLLLERCLKGAYLAILASAAVRFLLRSISWRIVLFLSLWTVISVLPTFQIWMISPNLVGGRLFYMGSAPFLILLSFLALPAIDEIKKSYARALAIFGSIALLCIVSIWSYWLQIDLKAWSGAAASMSKFKADLLSKLKDTAEGKKLLLLNLPSDFSGAGMLTRGQYLRFMLSPPHTTPSLAGKVEILEAPDQSESFDYSKELKRKIEEGNLSKILYWNDSNSMEAGSFSSRTFTNAAAARSIYPSRSNLMYLPASALTSSGQELDLDKLEKLELRQSDTWELQENGKASFQASKHGLKIRSGSKAAVLLIQSEPVSTLQTSKLEIEVKSNSKSCPELRFLCLPEIEPDNSENEPDPSKSELDPRPFDQERIAGQSSFIPRFKGKQQFLSFGFNADKQNAVINLAKNKEWALANKVSYLGIYLPPGDYEIELGKISFN